MTEDKPSFKDYFKAMIKGKGNIVQSSDTGKMYTVTNFKFWSKIPYASFIIGSILIIVCFVIDLINPIEDYFEIIEIFLIAVSIYAFVFILSPLVYFVLKFEEIRPDYYPIAKDYKRD